MPEQLNLYRQELLSDDIQEVIGYRMHWIIRKGNAIFLFIILSLLFLTWVIQYPETINASARVVALNPPKLISSRADGKLMKLFVTNEQLVYKGKHLGYIESVSNYEEVMSLQNWVELTILATKANTYDVLKSNQLPQYNDLGELQTIYQEFQNQLAQIKQTLADGYYQKKGDGLQRDLQYLASLKNNIYQKKTLLEQDQELQNNEYKAYETLAKDKVIAPLELNLYKSKLIAKDQSLKQVGSEITNNDISSHNKQKELLDLQKYVADQQQLFHSSLLTLKSHIQKWIQEYVLVAPEDGKVLFISTLQENELIVSGQGLFYIEPKHTEFYSELMASQKGIGKIKVGQKVLIRMESYPSNEFGYLVGTINNISNIPNRNDSFLIKVDLPHGLQTNYNKNIFFRNDLAAEAEIITDNRKLFDRLTGELRKKI
jgi:multidrug resistance efflux pump